MPDDLGEAVDRVMAGPALKSRVMTPNEKRITAYHEAAHALLGHVMPHAPPVAKVTVIARGESGGHTRYKPDDDNHYWSVDQLNAVLTVLMAGKAAEEKVFGNASTGSSHDLHEATILASQMVTTFGLSNNLAPRFYDAGGARPAGVNALMNGGIHGEVPMVYAGETLEAIDHEIDDILTKAYNNAVALMDKHEDELRQVAEFLLEHETMSEDEIVKLIGEKATAEGMEMGQP